MEYSFAFITLFIGLVLWVFIRVFKGTKKARKNEEIFLYNLTEKDLPPDQIIFTSHTNSKKCLSVNQKKSNFHLKMTISSGFLSAGFHLEYLAEHMV
jgi:hypothetical protein